MAFIPQPPAPFPPPEPPPRVTVLGLRGRQWMVVAIVVGCCYLAASVLALGSVWRSYTREPTDAELEIASRAEVAQRWEVWPAERVFPDRIPYRVFENVDAEYATRAGIVPDTGCAQAVDAALVGTLRRHGCKAILRATYVGALNGIVTTVGVVVFPDAHRADRAYEELPKNKRPDGSGGVEPALKAAAFPGTASGRFTDAARQSRGSDRGGPYVVLTTSGHTDGRPAAAVERERPGQPFILAPQLATALEESLSTPARPDCSRREWQC
ncbi:hypothetical protein [Actinomadura sp. WMMB 499]|uniref:hypothetical protein n=1 Tax=Actinomadura sp. WMMB 499 TaxID=1219491 RepID=UPI001247E00E|nr:hypothetical protein [Actinomadura sp. WMMB 499]QFG25018.1 hypothetical protein F7P10_31665 [Actinomadura sp. WMMB 499]